MAGNQKVSCRKCGATDFEYDNYWKEYSCSKCGWIVQDAENISSLSLNKEKASYTENAEQHPISGSVPPRQDSAIIEDTKVPHNDLEQFEVVVQQEDISSNIVRLHSLQGPSYKFQILIDAIAKKGKPAVDPLVEVFLFSDKYDTRSREAAGRALGRLKDKKSIPSLVSVFKNENDRWDIRWRAAWALGEIGDQEAVGPLIDMLVTLRKDNYRFDKHYHSIRNEAAIALGKIGGARAVEALMHVLDHLNSSGGLMFYAHGDISLKGWVESALELIQTSRPSGENTTSLTPQLPPQQQTRSAEPSRPPHAGVRVIQSGHPSLPTSKTTPGPPVGRTAELRRKLGLPERAVRSVFRSGDALGGADRPAGDPSFRMKIEDVFDISRRGTTVVGQVDRGTVTLQDKVHLNGQSTVRQVVVIGIEMWGRSLSTAKAAQRIGVILANVSKDEVQRGDVLAGSDETGQELPIAVCEGPTEATQYFDVPVTAGDKFLCSDRECPCTGTDNLVPGQTGFLYISPEVFEMRKDALSQAAIQRKMARLREQAFGPNSRVYWDTGTTQPVFLCQLGAERRGLDLKVAAEDAEAWQRSGRCPLTPTPQITT